MTYSALERFHDALKGRPQDRVPIFPMIAAWAAVNFSDSPPAQLARKPQRVVDAQIKAMESVGYDAFFAYADPLYIPQAFGCNVRFLEAILDHVTAFLIEFSRALIENGANVIFLPEPTASAAMISPAAFRKLVLPRLQTITDKLDVPCILHICGDTSPVLDSIGQTGADVISLDQCMNLSESRSTLPGAVIGGNVDPINSLLNGSQNKIAEDTLNCLRTAGTDRFILMSGCGVPPGTPVEKVAVMVKTAKAYGMGPRKA